MRGMHSESHRNNNNRKKVPHKWLVWTSLLFILLSTAVVRIRLLDAPLERNEGASAYVGQLILHGIPPYGESFGLEMPGLYGLYAISMAFFGQSIRGIHFGLFLVNAVTIIFLFFVVKGHRRAAAACFFCDREGIFIARSGNSPRRGKRKILSLKSPKCTRFATICS